MISYVSLICGIFSVVSVVRLPTFNSLTMVCILVNFSVENIFYSRRPKISV